MNTPKTSFWLSSKGLVALSAIGFIVYFLWMENRQHRVEWFPYLIFLLCPFMHLLMHDSHGGHSHHHQDSDDQQNSMAPHDQRGEGHE